MRLVVGVMVFIVMSISMPAAYAASTEDRLRALENLVRSQQEEIKELRGELKQQKVVGAAASDQAARAEDQAKAVEKKATASIPQWINKFTPFGDMRLRQEGFYDQPTPTNTNGKGPAVTARNRTRIRYRLGLQYVYSDELSVTGRLASGNPNDPISTNQTLTGNFTPFSINLDWAYMTFTPGNTFGIRPGLFSISGGKFPNPMFRVGEMVWDDDLSPEGFSEMWQFLDRPYGPLDQVKLYTEQWSFNEVSTGGHDGWMFGGQVNPTMHAGPFLVEGGIGQFWWNNVNSIAVATSKNSTSFNAAGQPIANSSFNSSLVNTNLVTTQTIQPPPVGGKTPASFTSITGFQSGFNESNVTLAATLPNAAGTMPLRFFFDYVYNWMAPNDDAHGVMGGFKLGAPKVRGDWAGILSYEYLMQEAALSTFTWSDFGVNGGTNEKGPVVELDYQLLDPLTLAARGIFTEYIIPPPNTKNRMDARMQLDAMVRF